MILLLKDCFFSHNNNIVLKNDRCFLLKNYLKKMIVLKKIVILSIVNEADAGSE